MCTPSKSTSISQFYFGICRPSPVFTRQQPLLSRSKKICSRIIVRKSSQQQQQQEQEQQQPIHYVAQPTEPSQQNYVRTQFLSNPFNWFLILIIGTAINFVIRQLLGFWSSKLQSLKFLKNLLNCIFGVSTRELTVQENISVEVSQKLTSAEEELGLLKQQLGKRETQLQEALDVADELEQQVLVSIETIKQQEEQKKKQADEIKQSANQKIHDIEDEFHEIENQQLLSQQELQRKLNDNISQLQQSQKMYEDEIIAKQKLQNQFTELEQSIEKQLKELNEQKEKEFQCLKDKVNQLEDIKEDNSNLMIQLRDYEDEIDDFKNQLEKAQIQLQEQQKINETKIDEMIQENEELKIKQQKIVDNMQEQIDGARKDAEISDQKLVQMKSQIALLVGELIGSDQRLKIEEILAQPNSVVMQENFKVLLQNHIDSTVEISSRELKYQLARLQEENKQNSGSYLSQLQSMKQALDEQQKVVENLVNENKDGNGSLGKQISNVQNKIEKNKEDTLDVSKQTQESSQNGIPSVENMLAQKLKELSPWKSTAPEAQTGDSIPASETSIQTSLQVISAGAIIPHPNKKLGDDAFFVEGIYLGVADGVGGWEKEGIDPGNYSRRLMQNFGFEIKKFNPMKALQNAQNTTLVEGSCTACGAKLLEDGVLEVINVGDTGCRVFRNNQCVFQTRPQMHQFNMPYQLAWEEFLPNANMATSGNFYKVKCYKGDVILLGTDGYFDNVWDKDTAQIIKQYLSSKEGQEISEQDVGLLAMQLCKQAQKNAVDDKYQSPFIIEVARAGVAPWGTQLFRKGGKLDDCTVVVAQIL